MADRVRPPREPFPAHSAPRRLFPLGLRRQTVAVRTPVCRRLRRPRPHHRSGHRIHRRQTLLLAARVAPFNHIPPGDGMHRVVRGLPRARCQVRVAVAQAPGPHFVPMCLRRLGLLDVKGTHRHGD